MRPIYWGLAMFLVGLVGWFESTNYYGAIVHSIPLGSTPPFEWQLVGWLIVAFALVWILSLPVAAGFEARRWRHSKQVSLASQ
jgi:predicted ferric reductase